MGEKVTRGPNCASRAAAAAAISSVERRVEQLPERRGADLGSMQRDPRSVCAWPDPVPPGRPSQQHPLGPDARGREDPHRRGSARSASRFSSPSTVTTTSRARAIAGKGERQARMRVQRRRRSRRRGARSRRASELPGNSDAVCPSGPRPRCTTSIGGAARITSSYASAPASTIERDGTSGGSRASIPRRAARAAPCPRSSRRMVERHEALVAEVHVDRRPVDRLPRAAPRSTRCGGLAARQRDRGVALLRRRAARTRGDVVDDLDRAREASMSAILPDRGPRRPSTSTRRSVDDWIDAPAPAAPDSSTRSRRGYRRARAADLGCGPGWHSAELGTPVVAFDAAPRCSTQVARASRPAPGRVVADLEHCRSARGALGGIVGAQVLHAHRGASAAAGAGRRCTGRCRSAARCTSRSRRTASRRTRRPLPGPALRRGGRPSGCATSSRAPGSRSTSSSTTARSGSTSRRHAPACSPTPSGPGCALLSSG